MNPLQEPISDVERGDVNFILKRQEWQAVKVPIRIDFAERFMCKLALGFAFKILGEGVMETSYVSELRRGLWTQDFQERKRLCIRGKNFWSQPENNRTLDMLHWPGAWMISLNAFPNGLAVTVITPGRHHLSILATEGHEGWPANVGHTYGAGQIYLVVPQRRIVVGPLPMIEYTSFKAGIGHSAALERLRGLEIDSNELPPKR